LPKLLINHDVHPSARISSTVGTVGRRWSGTAGLLSTAPFACTRSRPLSLVATHSTENRMPQMATGPRREAHLADQLGPDPRRRLVGLGASSGRDSTLYWRSSGPNSRTTGGARL
jgi:hypothetical protein